jgi:hypothetical protein
MSPTAYRYSARFGAGVRRHFSYARCAASTAALTSSAVESWNSPTRSSLFAGLRFSNAFPLPDFTHWPSM